MNRIAPNNQLPATHFIEVYKGESFGTTNQQDFINNPTWNCVEIYEIDKIDYELNKTISLGYIKTIAIFRIRENKLPTKHKF
jgi:hypothetical protein